MFNTVQTSDYYDLLYLKNKLLKSKNSQENSVICWLRMIRKENYNNRTIIINNYKNVCSLQ